MGASSLSPFNETALGGAMFVMSASALMLDLSCPVSAFGLPLAYCLAYTALDAAPPIFPATDLQRKTVFPTIFPASCGVIASASRIASKACCIFLLLSGSGDDFVPLEG